MLRQIAITNVAIIEKMHIDFDSGLNVLSGETGAGKSIIIDSLNFVLGAKADKGLIRFGKDYMQVDAVFEVENAENLPIELEEDNLIVITRKLSAGGKGEIRVNGEIYTLGMLKELSQLLIDVYGQSEHIALLKESNHQKLIDSFAGSELQVQQEKLTKLIGELKKVNDELESFGSNEFERKRLIDLYAYQSNEIDNAKLIENEEQTLIAKKMLMQNSGKIKKALETTLASLEKGDYAAVNMISDAKSQLLQCTKFDEELECELEKIENIRLELYDICDRLNAKLSEVDFDEKDADYIFERLDLIKQLKKKYGSTIEEILAYASRIQLELEKLQNSDSRIQKLEQQKSEILENIYKVCEKLHSLRKKTAIVFEKQIEAQFEQVALKNAKFVVEFGALADKSEIELKLTNSGLDSIRFLFSANVGEPPRPLSKVASGGEMSRLMLAVKQVAVDEIETQIFDEIDSGMSGQTVLEIAKKLSSIARKRQVLCISHSGGIVAIADTNIFIEKRELSGKTVSFARKLTDDEKPYELARIISAIEGSTFGTKYAEELLNWAKEQKK